jgi:heme/copper-type cytochrome/quinol oxidase subunit 2
LLEFLNDSSILFFQVNISEQENEPDINQYHHSTNFAHALMNLALLAANANQLKYLIESAEYRPLFYISLAFIVASLLIQLVVKVCLVINCRYNLNNNDEARKAVQINNFVTIAILAIMLINVAVSGVILAETKGLIF